MTSAVPVVTYTEAYVGIQCEEAPDQNIFTIPYEAGLLVLASTA